MSGSLKNSMNIMSPEWKVNKYMSAADPQKKREKELQPDGSYKHSNQDGYVPPMWNDGIWQDRTNATPRVSNSARNEFKKSGSKCRYCHATEDLTVDHKVPLILGGLDTKANWQILCGRCNSMKSNIPHQRLKQIFKWHMQIIMERAARKVKKLWP